MDAEEPKRGASSYHGLNNNQSVFCLIDEKKETLSNLESIGVVQRNLRLSSPTP